MKNVDDLIESAAELAAQGFSKGEISDELNVSRETASWLVERGTDAGGGAGGDGADEASSGSPGSTTATGADTGADASTDTGNGTAPDDIHVDWSAVGRDSARLSAVGTALADLLRSGDPAGDDRDVDLVIGIEKAGTPLATTVATEIDADLGTYAPQKHQWEEGDIDQQSGGGFSRNFADIRGRECYVIDDTITSGTTMTETVDAIEREGGTPVSCAVLVDKQGLEDVGGVPVHSLLQVIRVSREEA
ncbi:orotate phosphoribosyltransferase-like protein [Halobacteriales archaeon QS_8_65_32]|jgi:orotate phosphoribosyltransferase|nr:MAG: orotate phosphoribosyltransferase-like protein [Halobacteriales archaeon QS_8_65_32]